MMFCDWWRKSPMSRTRPELYGICEAVWLAAVASSEALALLRELNDALLPIPDALQARVDAVLDRAEEK